jgi:hypothetical protein
MTCRLYLSSVKLRLGVLVTQISGDQCATKEENQGILMQTYLDDEKYCHSTSSEIWLLQGDSSTEFFHTGK